MRHLKALERPDGYLWDDHVEGHFLHDDKPKPNQVPWVGMFHYPPPDTMHPLFWQDNDFGFLKLGLELSTLWELAIWHDSQAHLQLALCMSNHLADWLRQKLTVPVVVLRHPSGVPQRLWSWSEYAACPTLVQAGDFLSNVEFIYQVAAPLSMRKLYVQARGTKATEVLHRSFKAYWRDLNARPSYHDVITTERLSTMAYDNLLRSSILGVEFWAASANNRIVEAMAYCQPVLTNRHPAVEEYLGTQYPMYYQDPSDRHEIAALLSDENVLRTHEYLKRLDRRFLRIESFVSDFAKALDLIETNAQSQLKEVI